MENRRVKTFKSPLLFNMLMTLKTSMRTHTNGELTKKHVGEEVTLCGWVNSRRDHGGIIFIDLRDRYGFTQIIFDPEFNKDIHKAADSLRREDCIQVTGKVKERKKGMTNPNLSTGEIEVFISKLTCLKLSVNKLLIFKVFNKSLLFTTTSVE